MTAYAGYRWATRPPPTLTARQQECVMWTWYGLEGREIAAVLGLAPDTVANTLHNAHERLGLVYADCPRTQAALWLIRECERATGIRLGERAEAGRAA